VFNNLTNFSYTRSAKEAFGFFLVYLFSFYLIYMVLGIPLQMVLEPSMGDSVISRASKKINIKFSSVLDKNGSDVLDKDSSFETDSFFTKENLQVSDGLVRHFKTERIVTTLG